MGESISIADFFPPKWTSRFLLPMSSRQNQNERVDFYSIFLLDYLQWTTRPWTITMLTAPFSLRLLIDSVPEQ
jgi:hypothetical protein